MKQCELAKLINDGKGAIIRIVNCLEFNKLEIPSDFCLREVVNDLVFMQGYVACLKKHGFKGKDN